MPEYIEREAAIKALTLHDCDSAGSKMAICDLPAADVAPVMHGRWKLFGADKRGRGGNWNCSACHKSYPYRCDYCPNCGAKMDG